MVGNDRSGTVDANLNLLKAVELTLTGGYDLIPFTDGDHRQDGQAPALGCSTPATRPSSQPGSSSGRPMPPRPAHIIRRIVELYEQSESIRARYAPTPYVSCLVKGCAQKGLDITEGGAELGYVTIEAVTYATTVDSLLAVKYLVYDQKVCTMAELVQALKDNWVGHEVLQARALHKAPKYGRDDDAADALARQVMELWTEETWKYKTRSTGRQFRPGMLSWNYWVADSFILPASPDGRPRANSCRMRSAPPMAPTSMVRPPTSTRSARCWAARPRMARAIGTDYLNLLPNGGSHTMTFNPSILRDPEHREKFKAFLKGYIENGGSALQINLIDADLLRDAQKHPENYRHLLVRVTGYNAYFTSIGRELQNEIIARESHQMK